MELRRDATINGQRLRFADVLRWAERTEVEYGVDLGSQEANDGAPVRLAALQAAATASGGAGRVMEAAKVFESYLRGVSPEQHKEGG